MKNRVKMIAVLAAVAAMAAPQVIEAQDITFKGSKCPLNIMAGTTPEAEAAASKTKLKRVVLLGVVDDNYVAILYNKGNKGYITKAEAEENIVAFDVNSLEHVNNWVDFGNGNSGDVAMTVQQELIALNYLQGGADGYFGNQSAEAVKAFQTAEGLEATGVVDVFTYLLLHEKTSGNSEIISSPYPPVYTVESKFEDIYQLVADASALEPYLTSEWSYSFDVFDGVGEISNQSDAIGGWTDETGKPIDRLSISISKEVYLERNENGVIEMIPAFLVSSTGAYRPNVKTIKLRVGNSVSEMEVLKTDVELSGSDVIERDIVPITDEVQALIDGAEAGAQKTLRLHGSLKDYDINI